MTKRTPLAALVLIFALPLYAEDTSGKVIYGNDDRLDVYQVENAHIREFARSTVALFEASQITPTQNSSQVRLETVPYGEGWLCKEEPFYGQPEGAFCSGSLVGPDLIMTAGHCIQADTCPEVKFVFDFALRKKDQALDETSAENVYSCTAVTNPYAETGSGSDWALVRLDRPVTGRTPLPVSRTGALEKGAPLFVIGHPYGIPTKVAGGANVREVQEEDGYFTANLDTYGGNSGSAVFNATNGLIEGILVRGEADYEVREDGACYLSKHCKDDECTGEDVTKISTLMDRIPDASPLRSVLPKQKRRVALIEKAAIDAVGATFIRR